MLNYGFKRDLNKYIADHVRASFPIHSLNDVVNFNIAFGPKATKYDQDLPSSTPPLKSDTVIKKQDEN